MTAVLEQIIKENDAGSFVQAIFEAEESDVPPSLVNIENDIKWAIESDNPHLQQYARESMRAMDTIMQAEKLELDVGEGGFSLDSLQSIVDAFKTGDWGGVFDKVSNLFNGASGGEDIARLQQQAMQQAQAAQEALQRAQADQSLDQEDRDRVADMNRDDLSNGNPDGAVAGAVRTIAETITP